MAQRHDRPGQATPGFMTSTQETSTQSQAAQLAQIREWFDGDLGRQTVRTETAILDQLLGTYFGYHLLQVSVQPRAICTASPIHNKMQLGLDPDDTADLMANPSALPFADDSIDVVVAQHVLEFANNPHQLLREFSRIVLPMGRIIVIGFNPASLWGVWKAFARYRGRAPWNAAFIRSGRLMDWMNLLSFKIDRAQFCQYGVPVASRRESRPDFSRGLSRRANLPVGGVYVIVAQKHVGTMTQIRPNWQRSSRAFGQLSVVRPASRDRVSRRKPPVGV